MSRFGGGTEADGASSLERTSQITNIIEAVVGPHVIILNNH